MSFQERAKAEKIACLVTGLRTRRIFLVRLTALDLDARIFGSHTLPTVLAGRGELF